VTNVNILASRESAGFRQEESPAQDSEAVKVSGNSSRLKGMKGSDSRAQENRNRSK